MTGSPRHAVAPSYDQVSRLTQLNVDSSTYLGNVSYNTNSQVTQLKVGAATSNPRIENYSYDSQTGLLTAQTVTNVGATSTYMDLGYSYSRGGSAGTLTGKTGQMTNMVDNLDHNRDRKYESDALGRLADAKGGTAAGASSVTANWTQSYSYDRYGNKTGTSASGVDQTSTSIPTDGLASVGIDTATNRINTSGWTYDNAGNLIRGQDQSGTWQRFEYDAAGRLVKIKDDSGTVIETYTYGASRERLVNEYSSGRTYYVWGGGSVVAEYNETTSGTTPNYNKSYIYAGSRLLMTDTKASSTTETVEFQHPDRLGTQLVTNGATGTSFRQTIFPFGTPVTAETTGNTNQVFTSYDRSAGTGLDYADNRTYSKGQSRFTQADPLGILAARVGPQSNNLYVYVLNTPTDLIDPAGLEEGDPDDPIRVQTWAPYLYWGLGHGGGGHEPLIGDPGDEGGGGGDDDPGAQPHDKGRPLFRWKHCKQGTNGADIPEIKHYLDHYGLSQFIDMNSIKMDTHGTDHEGITFNFTNAGAAAAYLNDKSNGFNVTGGFLGIFGSNQGVMHNGSVSGGKVSLDARGIQGTGELPQKSLQFDIGSPPKKLGDPITGYADLDCDSPVQRPISHACKVLGICGG